MLQTNQENNLDIFSAKFQNEFHVVKNQIFFLKNFIIAWEEQDAQDYLGALYTNVIDSWFLPNYSADELLEYIKEKSIVAKIVFNYLELQSIRTILTKSKDIKEWGREKNEEFYGEDFPDAIYTFGSLYFTEINGNFFMDWNNQSYYTSTANEMEIILSSHL